MWKRDTFTTVFIYKGPFIFILLRQRLKHGAPPNRATNAAINVLFIKISINTNIVSEYLSGVGIMCGIYFPLSLPNIPFQPASEYECSRM